MSAPVIGGMADVMARIGAIQSMVASLAPRPAPAAPNADFASAMSTVSGTAAVSSPAVSSGGVSGAAIVAEAKTWLGVPYVWAGNDRSGIDCSGLVQQTLKKFGIDMPRIASDQMHEGTPVASLAQAQPGDLLGFGEPAYHIAIYVGDGKMIEAPEPGKTVRITDVWQTPTSIRRIAAADATPAAAFAGGISAAQLTASGINSSVAQYASMFAAAEAQYNLPSGMLAAVAQQESGGNPNAVSPAGAQGLMQFMPSTAAGYGIDPFDPAQAIPAAAKYLSGGLKEFGSVELALAAYNAGGGAVRQYGGVPPFTETQNYVRSITAMMARLG